MIWFVSIGILLFILIFILLLLQIKISIHYVYQKNNHHVAIHVYYIKLRVFQRNIKFNEYEVDEEKLIELLKEYKKEEKDFNLNKLFKNITKQIQQLKKILMLMIKSISIHKFTWTTHFGTGEASSTGALSGGVWALKGTLVGFIYEQIELKSQPKISVIPHFQQKGLYSEVTCIVSIRLGKAIHTAMQLLRNYNSKEEVYI